MPHVALALNDKFYTVQKIHEICALNETVDYGYINKSTSTNIEEKNHVH